MQQSQAVQKLTAYMACSCRKCMSEAQTPAHCTQDWHAKGATTTVRQHLALWLPRTAADMATISINAQANPWRYLQLQAIGVALQAPLRRMRTCWSRCWSSSCWPGQT